MTEPHQEAPAPKPAVSSVAREAKDLLLKLQAAGLGGGFLASLGIDLAPIVEALPAELPVLEVRVEQPDTLFRLADRSIVNFEFQSTKEATDLRRFYHYQYAASEHYDSEVYTVVFYGPGITEAPSVLHRGSSVFTVTNIYIGTQESEAVLADLRAKLGRGQPLDATDLARLKLVPLMAHQRPLPEVLRDAVSLAGALPQSERDPVVGTILGMAYNYVGQGIIDQLLGGPDVANPIEKFIEDALLRRRAEGEREGAERGQIVGKQDDILEILTSRFGTIPPGTPDQVSRLTDIASLRS
ncbi:MAG: hypothetical protein ACRDGS_14630, partial [Chloroflexota bacterium]